MEPPNRPAHEAATHHVLLSHPTASCPTPILAARGVLSANQSGDDAEDKNEWNEGRMVTQLEVLTFIAKRTTAGHAVTAEDLAREFWMSPDAAVGHLRRVWRERLVEALSMRPRRFRFRPEPGEAVLQLRFRLASRGRERLRWYKRHEEDNAGGFFR